MRHAACAGLGALIAACALAGAPAVTSASDAPAIPMQGVYEWCDPSRSPATCAHRLQRIGQAGFRAVVNDWAFKDLSEQGILDYAQAAATAGVRVIWPLHALSFREADPGAANLLTAYPLLAAGCGCSDNQGLLAYLIRLLRSLPNTWGYYLADEPTSDTRASLAQWVFRIKALDPDHPRLIMGCGVCEGGAAEHVTWLTDFDVAVGTDAYPVFGGPPDPSGSYASVQQNVATLDRAATAAGRQQVVALQAWRWGDSVFDSQAAQLDPAGTRFPTREEVQAQRDAAIENAHPDLILWFTLTQVIGWVPGQQLSYWADPADPEQRWGNLVGGAFAPARARAVTAQRPGAATAQPKPKPRNQAPLARFTIRRGGQTRLGTRFVVDARRSKDPDGRIVRYEWRVNGKRLAGSRSRRRAFRVRRPGTHRLTLTVTDNRGARAAAKGTFRMARRHGGGRLRSRKTKH
jgi:hypothetical protein